VTELDIEIC